MTFIILQGHRLLVILALPMACFLEEAQNSFSISMSHVIKNLLRHWRMKPKLQLQTHQSNAQLKIQVFVMTHSVGPLKCWELLTEWHIVTSQNTWSSPVSLWHQMIQSTMQGIAFRYACEVQGGRVISWSWNNIPDSHSDDFEFYHWSDLCVCVWIFLITHQNFHYTRDGTWVCEEY